MSDHAGRFDRLLASLHEVAFDYARWPTASALIDEVLGTHGNSMMFGEGEAGQGIHIHFAWLFYRGQRVRDLERLYYEDMYPIDERVPRLRQAPDSRILHMTDLYTEEERKTSPAYHALRTRGHAGNAVNVRLDGPGGSRIVWVIHDPLDANGWTSTQLDIVRGLLPHIRHAVRVQQTLVNSGALGETMTALLDNTGIGILQLDPRGRILAANDRARGLLRAANPLFDENGFLLARSPRDNDELQRRLGRALPPFGAQVATGRGLREGGSMLVSRTSPLPPLMLHVNPVGQSERRLGAWPVAALVLIEDPTPRTTVEPTVIGAALGLSPMQSRVAVHMAQGMSVPAIAAKMDRRISTIRTHVKAMYGRLGLTRQQELVRLVRSLSRSVRARR